LLKIIKENHNEGILNLMMHGKTNAVRAIKNILWWLWETKWLIAQFLKEIDDDDDWFYLTTACYKMED